MGQTMDRQTDRRRYVMQSFAR